MGLETSNENPLGRRRGTGDGGQRGRDAPAAAARGATPLGRRWMWYRRFCVGAVRKEVMERRLYQLE